jgi:hypothetical protein
VEHVVVPSIDNQNLAMVIASGTPVLKMHELRALQIQERVEGTCGGGSTASDGGAAGSDAGTADSGSNGGDGGDGGGDGGTDATTDSGSP